MELNTVINVWFHGGGYVCVWSFGVAEAFKAANIRFNFVGGYSSGSAIAIFLLGSNDVESCYKSIIESPYGPLKGRFKLMGKHHINLKYVIESFLGEPAEFKPEKYNKKLWIPIQPLKISKGAWRNNYRDYDDIIDTSISSQCVPVFSHGEFTKCYYDDFKNERGPTIDGGIFSTTFPKCWDEQKTIVVSPWGNGDIVMSPRAKISDICFPRFDDIKKYRMLGQQQAIEYIKKQRENQ